MSLCNKFYTSTAPTFAFHFRLQIWPFLFHSRFQLWLHICIYACCGFALVQPEFVLLFLLTMGLCNKFSTWAVFCVALSLSKFTFSFSSLSLTLCELSVCGATSFTPRLLLPVLFHHRFLFQILPLILRPAHQHVHYYIVYYMGLCNELCTLTIFVVSRALSFLIFTLAYSSCSLHFASYGSVLPTSFMSTSNTLFHVRFWLLLSSIVWPCFTQIFLWAYLYNFPKCLWAMGLCSEFFTLTTSTFCFFSLPFDFYYCFEGRRLQIWPCFT